MIGRPTWNLRQVVAACKTQNINTSPTLCACVGQSCVTQLSFRFQFCGGQYVKDKIYCRQA